MLLAPVAFAPHGADTARQAQALVEQARARIPVPAGPATSPASQPAGAAPGA